MITLTIYGANDDLLELTAEHAGGTWAEEINITSGSAVLYTSCGLEITVEYVGTWDVHVSHGPASASAWTHTPAVDEDADDRDDGTPGYSDRLKLTGLIDWLDIHYLGDVTRVPLPGGRLTHGA